MLLWSHNCRVRHLLRVHARRHFRCDREQQSCSGIGHAGTVAIALAQFCKPVASGRGNARSELAVLGRHNREDALTIASNGDSFSKTMRGVRIWPAHAAPIRAPGSGRECAPLGSVERRGRLSRVEPRDGMLVWCAQFEPGCQSGLGCAPHGDASESAPHFLSRKISRCGPREFESASIVFYASILTGPVKLRPGGEYRGTAEQNRHTLPRRRRRRHFKFGAGMAGRSPPRPGAAEDGPVASKPRSFFRLCLCQQAGGLRGIQTRL